MMDPVKVKQVMDDVRIFVELSGHEFDRKKFVRILQLVQASCTVEMIAEDMDLDEKEVMDYTIILRLKGLISVVGEE